MSLVSGAVIVFEILLTRIYSVATWYHFAFLVISMAMLGLTAGAVFVQISGSRGIGIGNGLAAIGNAGVWAILMSVSMVASPFSLFFLPPLVDISGMQSLAGVGLYLSYGLLTVPFFAAGVVVAILLTRLPDYMSRLYGFDLIGAAAGCLVSIFILSVFDAPTCVFVVAAMGCAGAHFLGAAAGTERQAGVAATLVALFLAGAALNTVLARSGSPHLSLVVVKEKHRPPPEYERWSPSSRIVVWGNAHTAVPPFGWGLSTQAPNTPLPQLFLDIDGLAETVLTGFDGDVKKLEYLNYDVSNLAHVIKPGGSVLVLGVGGGRDILSALTAGAGHVTAVEINATILNALCGDFGRFTGHLDKNPGVSIHNDEARGWLTRSPDHFDLIQISLIDTWAAVQSGALALSENSLYTLSAWKTFIVHLTSDGALSVSRWYDSSSPCETYRLVSLAHAALSASGASEPGKHIFVARAVHQPYPSLSVATVVVSRAPLKEETEQLLLSRCKNLGFEVLYHPASSHDSIISSLARRGCTRAIENSINCDVSAPPDDRPFFFQTSRKERLLNDLVSGAQPAQGSGINLRVIAGLLVLSVAASVALILGPLFFKSKEDETAGREFSDSGSVGSALSAAAFFVLTGTGYILFEIAQMQRLQLLLGDPTKSLAVVLFCLLLSSGLGSLHCQGISRSLNLDHMHRAVALRMGLLVGLLGLTGAASQWLLEAAISWSEPVRIGVCVLVIAPCGYLMGMCIPLGLGAVSTSRLAGFGALFWGANGAASVIASVGSVFLLLFFGISATYWISVSCYIVCACIFLKTHGFSAVSPPRAGL